MFIFCNLALICRIFTTKLPATLRGLSFHGEFSSDMFLKLKHLSSMMHLSIVPESARFADSLSKWHRLIRAFAPYLSCRNSSTYLLVYLLVPMLLSRVSVLMSPAPIRLILYYSFKHMFYQNAWLILQLGGSTFITFTSHHRCRYHYQPIDVIVGHKEFIDESTFSSLFKNKPKLDLPTYIILLERHYRLCSSLM